MNPVLRPQLQLRHLWLGLGLLIAAGIAVGSLVPSSELPNLRVSDKWEHAVSYLLLAFWFASIFTRSSHAGLAVALLAFGGALELLQGAMRTGREADLHDLLADGAGILCGIALALTPLGLWATRLEAMFFARRAA